MSPTDKEIMGSSPDCSRLPPQGALVPCGTILSSWRAEFDSVQVDRVADGRRVLRCRQGGQLVVFMLSPENASYLAALLGPGDVVLQGEPD